MAKKMDIMDMVLGIMVASSLVPAAIGQWLAANQSGWSSSLILMWNLVATFVVIGILYRYYSEAKGAKST